MLKKTLSIAVLAGGSMLMSILANAQTETELQMLELASQGQTQDAMELVSRRTDVNVTDSDGTTALHWAAYFNDAELADRLVRRGADVSVSNHFNSTPLMEAATQGNAEIIEILLEAGADPNEPGADGQSPLMVAARTGSVEALEVLLEHGADPNLTEHWRGQTALMWAAAQQQAEAVRVLLEHDANPNARSALNNWKRQVTAESRMKILPPGGLTPLLYAAREGCAQCAQYLVEGGADINMDDPDGISPLLMANLNAKWDTGKVLLEAGANLDKWDIYGRNPLYAAVDYNTLPHGGRPDKLSADLTSSLEMVELLLEAGANPNIQLKLFPPYRALGPDRGADGLLRGGSSSLFRAARGADIPVMKLLLEYGALVDLPNENGVTPLIVAAGFRQSPIDTRGRFRNEAQAYEATKLLLETGEVDVNAMENSAGQTALFGAATQGWDSVVELLLEHGADPTIEDNFGNTVVDAAMGRAGMFGRGAGTDAHIETAALLESAIAEYR